MQRKTLIISAVAGVIGLTAIGAAAVADDYGCYRWNSKYQNGDTMGFMGPGRHMKGGPGPMARFFGGPTGSDRNLSADNVRDIFEGMLAWRGNTRLKVGNVAADGDKAYTVDIVTQEGSLVQVMRVDRATGRMQPTR